MESLSKAELDYYYQQSFDVDYFREVDPCGVVYALSCRTSRQLDIELGAFFVAMISWGNRKAIRHAAFTMVQDEMQWRPADFILLERYEESYSTAKNNCVYRTLNADAFKQVCRRFRSFLLQACADNNVSTSDITLEKAFERCTIEDVISLLASLASPARLGTFGKSACKRICMFLRWMIRPTPPDFGIWHHFTPSQLYAIMDVHVSQQTQCLLSHPHADWKGCVELTNIFRQWCSKDPLKYDIALMVRADSHV